MRVISIRRPHAATAICLALLAGLAAPVAAQDAGVFGRVIRIERDAFGPDAGQITFSELPLGSKNPIYSPGTYGAAPEGVSVGFGGFFQGQQIGDAGRCPRGAAITGCVIGRPVAPLRLAMEAPATKIVHDGSNPHSPSLSGSPVFNGPVSMVFDHDVAGIGLAGGFFNTPESTAIQAFDRQGNLIGGVRNLKTGMEYLALVTDDGADLIAGVQFSLVGAENAGFAIDDLSFGNSSQLARENIEALQRRDGVTTAPELIPGMQLSRPLSAP